MSTQDLENLRRDILGRAREAGVYTAHGAIARATPILRGIDFALRSIEDEAAREALSLDATAVEVVTTATIRAGLRDFMPGQHRGGIDEIRRAWWYRPCIDGLAAELARVYAKAGPCPCVGCGL